MFKKSLLALALAGAALTANATVVNNAKDTTIALTQATADKAAYGISNQGLPLTRGYTLASGTNEVLAINLNATEIASLEAGSRIRLKVSGAFFTNHATVDANVREIVTSSGADDANATVATGATATLVNTPSVHYFVVPTIAETTALTIALNDLPLQIEAGASAVTFTAELVSTSNVVVPTTASAVATSATLKDQWKNVVGKLDAKIDVSKDRKTFVGTPSTSDKLSHVITQQASGAKVTSVKYTIYGDFSGVATVIGDQAGTYTINAAKTEAVATQTVGSTDSFVGDVTTLTLLTGTKVVAQKEAKFTTDVDVTYTANGSTKIFSLDAKENAGAWELNSSSMEMNFVPMGPNTQLIINATSQFKEAASVDVSYLAATGKMVSIADVATVAPGVVTKLGDKISAAILADMGTTTAKTKVKVSVNAPAGNVTFFTGFVNKSNGSRMALEQVTTTQSNAATAATKATAAAADAAAAKADAALNKAALVTANSALSTTAAATTATAQKAANDAAANAASDAAVGTSAPAAKLAGDAVCALNATNIVVATQSLTKFKTSTNVCDAVGD